MGEMVIDGGRNDDPRRLRDLLGRAASLASDHALTSVVVGIAAPVEDLLFPEIVDFFESALRVDDAIFRMTRERAVLVLADVDRDRAQEIVERLLADFRARVALVAEPELYLGYFEVTPEVSDVSVKHVLPALFRGAPVTH
jgi:hypothetical protein